MGRASDKQNREINAEQVQAIQQGDEKAIAELVRTYAERIYRFVYHQVGGREEDAEDIVQETFLAAIKSAHRFQGSARVSTWLYSIAAHKVADYHRRRRRRKEEPLPLLEFNLSELDSPEVLLEKTELRERIWAALERLPDHYRTVLVLRYIEGLTINEIMEVTGQSQKSVESTLTRAKRAMANILNLK